ncbi:CitMHS family transporter [Cytobacillus purgationiresistens]|uniref:CitMHS family citrate-Mg2+:H+ or citrate-Ca2+:H+ symporter n=1 Tax=Cytobacillus purgationiresistens TaxID=863449 RepID=A0ABU0AM45_9BACI|nr:citrate:proton symporter [Cytobacillus purgationiresistens]MDQ0271867.1 CitMHS family citrate-Mg2+:H+ or citrate-Ca2+:H+ symporter [Cytobacillus purgationiresistens]
MSLSLIGFITILVIVILLISGKVTPIVAMVLPPIAGALLAGYGISEIGGFFESGVSSVISVAIMFIFAIIFFGIMQDVGLFDPIINKMVAMSHGNIITVTVGTVIIAAIAHLDGSGASTFLLTIPALLPLYKRLKMNPYLLLLLIAGSASIMNMIPWAGPLGRTASVLEMDVTELWKPLIPIQIIGLVLMLVLAVFLGMREKRRIIRTYGSLEAAAALEVEEESVTVNEVEKENPLARPKLIWVNGILALLVLGVLISGVIPAGLAFMIGVSIALPINFRQVKDQMERIRAHAPSALTMATIIVAAGLFLGVLNGTGMLNAIANDVVAVLPAAIGPFIHIIVGLLGVPFDLVLSTDAYYFALMPVVDQIAASYGVASLSTAYAMIIGNIVGTFVSPLAPAVWLALGLAGLEMGRHLRYSLFWMWGLSIVLVLTAVLIGVI